MRNRLLLLNCIGISAVILLCGCGKKNSEVIQPSTDQSVIVEQLNGSGDGNSDVSEVEGKTVNLNFDFSADNGEVVESPGLDSVSQEPAGESVEKAKPEGNKTTASVKTENTASPSAQDVTVQANTANDTDGVTGNQLEINSDQKNDEVSNTNTSTAEVSENKASDDSTNSETSSIDPNAKEGDASVSESNNYPDSTNSIVFSRNTNAPVSYSNTVEIQASNNYYENNNNTSSNDGESLMVNKGNISNNAGNISNNDGNVNKNAGSGELSNFGNSDTLSNNSGNKTLSNFAPDGTSLNNSGNMKENFGDLDKKSSDSQ